MFGALTAIVVSAAPIAIDDGTLSMSVTPGAEEVCVAIPAGRLAPTCDQALAAQMVAMTSRASAGIGAPVFVASVTGEGGWGTLIVTRSKETGELGPTQIRALEAKFKLGGATVTSEEKRINGLQVVKLVATVAEDAGEGGGGRMVTWVLAGKSNYSVAVASAVPFPALEAMAEQSLGTVKLGVGDAPKVVTVEQGGGGSKAVPIAVGVVVLVLLGFGLRAAFRKDEDLPEPERAAKKKKRPRRLS